MKDLIYTYVNRLARCYSNDIAWISRAMCNVVWSLWDNIALDFSYAMLSGTSRTTFNRVLTCAVAPRVLRQHRTWIFLMKCFLEPFGQHCIRFWLLQCCPKSNKTKLHRHFLTQCCLEPLKQHCIAIWPFQYCPKNIKKTLNRIFSDAKLFGASQTIFHKVFTSASLEY